MSFCFWNDRSVKTFIIHFNIFLLTWTKGYVIQRSCYTKVKWCKGHVIERSWEIKIMWYKGHLTCCHQFSVHHCLHCLLVLIPLLWIYWRKLHWIFLIWFFTKFMCFMLVKNSNSTWIFNWMKIYHKIILRNCKIDWAQIVHEIISGCSYTKSTFKKGS